MFTTEETITLAQIGRLASAIQSLRGGDGLVATMEAVKLAISCESRDHQEWIREKIASALQDVALGELNVFRPGTKCPF